MSESVWLQGQPSSGEAALDEVGLGRVSPRTSPIKDPLSAVRRSTRPVMRCGQSRGLRVRCSAYQHVHLRTPVQVTVMHVPPWTVVDAGELQLKLQLEVSERVVIRRPASYCSGGHSHSGREVASVSAVHSPNATHADTTPLPQHHGCPPLRIGSARRSPQARRSHQAGPPGQTRVDALNGHAAAQDPDHLSTVATRTSTRAGPPGHNRNDHWRAGCGETCKPCSGRDRRKRTRPRAPRRRSTSLGERPGETGQEQSRHRAPGRLNLGSDRAYRKDGYAWAPLPDVGRSQLSQNTSDGLGARKPLGPADPARLPAILRRSVERLGGWPTPNSWAQGVTVALPGPRIAKLLGWRQGSVSVRPSRLGRHPWYRRARSDTSHGIGRGFYPYS